MKFMNEAGIDRVVRVVLGLALIAMGWSGFVQGGLGTFLLVVGFIPLLTGVVGFCPLYALFGFRTNKA